MPGYLEIMLGMNDRNENEKYLKNGGGRGKYCTSDLAID